MNTSQQNELEKRLAYLEQRVALLESLTLRESADGPPAPIAIAGTPPAAEPVLAASTEEVSSAAAPIPESAPPKPIEPIPSVWRSEYWLHLTGIVLLLFAVAFLFKYAIDQGWLTPTIRVLIGLLVGSGLLAAGAYLSERPLFRAMLFGGGIGAYYITGFATFQLYQLLPHGAVFGFMVFNTILAFVLAVRGDYLILALLAAAGGLATPFLLSSESGNIIGLIAYTMLVLLGTGAIYAYTGWQPLLWLSGAGGLLVLLIARIMSPGRPEPPEAEAWALQIGISSWWLLFWLLPVARSYLQTGWPSLRPTNVGWAVVDRQTELRPLLKSDLYALSLITPLIMLGFTAIIWTDSLGENVGWVALGLAVVYGLATYPLERRLSDWLGYFHLGAALLLATIGFLVLLEGSDLLAALVIQGVALQFLAFYLRQSPSLVIVDLSTCLPAFILFGRLVSARSTDWTWFDSTIDLLAIAAAAGIAWKLRTNEARQVGYALLAHIGLLIWLWRELVDLNDGQALVSAAWGVYTAALLMTGLYFNRAKIRFTALATLAVLVGKLFLIDLAFVNPLTRILLFFAFGGLFLALSYLVTRLWQPSRPQP